MTYTVLQGNNIDVLKTYPDNHFDSIVTDPPYGIDFLGKAWDANTGALETYQECLRVLKPGGHILAFSAARTYHHLAVTLEQAGFEIRDQIMWIYSSGFPKSQDVGKSIERSNGKRNKKTFMGKASNTNSVSIHTDCPNCDKRHGTITIEGCSTEGCPIMEKLKPADNEWSGWGTQLKPAHEPIALARKPISEKNIAANCLKYGTGALNIDATRVAYEDEADLKLVVDWANKYTSPSVQEYGKLDGTIERTHTEEQFKSEASNIGRFPSNVVGEIAEEYQKYFYCPKVQRKERHIGFDTADIPQIGSTHPDDIKKHPLWDPSIGGDAARLKQKIIDAGEYKGNNHPTVKPIELMKYLIKLITPPCGTVLDPFNGSGSTGCAAVELGFNYVGIDLDPKYVEISLKRIEAWNKDSTTYNLLFE